MICLGIDIVASLNDQGVVQVLTAQLHFVVNANPLDQSQRQDVTITDTSWSNILTDVSTQITNYAALPY